LLATVAESLAQAVTSTRESAALSLDEAALGRGRATT